MPALARGPGYPTRTYGDDLKLAPTRLRRVGLLVLGLAVLAFPWLTHGSTVDLMNQAAIAVIAAMGLNILTGYAGQISLGHAGLLGTSGFVAGIVGGELGLPFALAVPAAMASGAILGIVLGLPALRLRGLYLVLATLAFHFVAVFAITQYQSYRSYEVALAGLTLPDPSLGVLTIESARQWYFLLVGTVAIVLLYSLNVLRTRPGRAWIAVRDRDLVASALGINLLGYKLLAFVVSSVLTSLAGALFVYYHGGVSAETYTLYVAVIYLVMVIVGGLGSTAGTVLGAVFITFAPRLLTNAFEYAGASSAVQVNYLLPLQLAIFGLLMFGFLLFEPRGLIGIWSRIRSYLELWPFRYRPLAERRR